MGVRRSSVSARRSFLASGSFIVYDRDDMNRIIIDPDICNGQPVIEGTRITVQTVLEFLGAGDSIDEVLEKYPTLSREDVLECLRFSSELLRRRFSFQEVA